MLPNFVGQNAGHMSNGVGLVMYLSSILFFLFILSRVLGGPRRVGVGEKMPQRQEIQYYTKRLATIIDREYCTQIHLKINRETYRQETGYLTEMTARLTTIDIHEYIGT